MIDDDRYKYIQLYGWLNLGDFVIVDNEFLGKFIGFDEIAYDDGDCDTCLVIKCYDGTKLTVARLPEDVQPASCMYVLVTFIKLFVKKWLTKLKNLL